MPSSDLRPPTYRARIVDALIERYLRLFGAVEISGPKWCGKTWAALAHGASVMYVDRGTNLHIAQSDPAYALEGERPHVIDEWQVAPAIWDAVRHGVDDAAGQKGLWILTGSSTPNQPGMKHHSGAGRIGRIRMHPMTLQESGESSGSVSLNGLFLGEFSHGGCDSGIPGLANAIVRGGWPESIHSSAEDSQFIVREYLRLVFEESIPRLGGNPLIAQRVARSIARNLGQAVTNKTLAKDVNSLQEDEQPTESQLKTVARTVDLLRSLYLVDAVPGWAPAARSPLRMRRKSKLYFTDPSLAIGLLGLSTASLLDDWQTFGLAFENLAVRDLSVYAQALDGIGNEPLHYYRDDSGLEADVVVEKADGAWGAFEIKLTQDKVDTAATHLIRMRNKLMKDKKARTQEPTFLAVLTGVGDAPYRREDGVSVIPLRCLCA